MRVDQGEAMKTSLAARARARSLVVPVVSVVFALALPAAVDARGPDRDGDGLSNRLEVKTSRTDPRRADTDRDGLRDGYEVRKSHTNPRKADTDGDGASDGAEVAAGTDPLRKSSRPRKPAPQPPAQAPAPAPSPDPVPAPDPAPAPEAPAEPTPEPTPPPDTSAPNTTISSGPSGTVANSATSFGFSASEPGSSFTCRIDGGPWGACSSPKGYSGLANGAHTFDVRATDAAGNTDASPASRGWTIDVAPPSAGNNCMPDPSACGYPDVENTGVDPIIPRQAVSGTVVLATPGMVYENKTVTGSIRVTAQNVTIRNVKIVDTSNFYAIEVRAGGDWNRADANLTVDRTEIDLNGHLSMKGIAFNGYTLTRSFIHNGADCAFFGNRVRIEDNLCVLGPDANGDGWTDSGFGCPDGPHYDGLQTDGGGGGIIRHNTIRNPCGQTSAIIQCNVGQNCRDVTIDRNLMAGGGYTIYCSDDSAARETVTNNRFARTYFAKSGRYGPTARCDKAMVFGGNVWDDTGAAL